MPGISSPVSICNLALGLLNASSTILSIEQPNLPTETVCALWYDQTRQETLREMNWNFALKDEELAASATFIPPFNFNQAYPLPNNYIRLTRVHGYGEDNIPSYGRLKYRVKGGYILAGSSSTSSGTDSDGNPLALRITYVWDITDVTKFDKLFVKLFAYNLAVNMAYAITSKNTKVESLIQDRKMVQMKAYSVDGQEDPLEIVCISSWNKKRRNSASGAYAGPVTDLDGF